MVKESLLTQGNEAFQQGDYAEALACYERLLRGTPSVLKSSIEFNRTLTHRRLRAEYGEHAEEIIQSVQNNVKREQNVETLSPALIDLIHDSGLFDSGWYIAQYGEEHAVRGNPLTHYLTFGAELATNPSPDFDTAFYLSSNPDVEGAGLQPLVHFLEHGLEEGRSPKRYLHSETLPQTLGGLNITDLHQLEWDVESASWQSTDNDPHFYLEGLDLSKHAWCQLHMAVHSPNKRCHAKLYFDYGQGFNEQDAITVRFKHGEITTCVIKTEGPLKSIRFDPMESPGTFSLPVFKFGQVPEEEAAHTMRRWLDRQSGTSPGEGQYEAGGVEFNTLDELFEAYQEATASANDHSNVSYEEWMEFVEVPSLPDAAQIQTSLETWPSQPLISVVMPVYNAPEQYLRECIDSVLAQSYPNWELCIADDCSPNSYVKRVLREYEETDSRIRVVYRTENGHISRCSNSALEIAQGDYVALMDHDDQLPEHSLYFVVDALNEHPEAQIVYSDEDKIDEQGRRYNPHFKSNWNPDLFFSQNYVSHLGVYRRELLNTIDGFRPGFEGSQDQDLLLRCLPHVENDQIIHIPRVLYHWRALEGSTALASDEKSYTTEAGIRALQDYFSVQGPADVEVEAGLLPNTYRVRWPVPKPEPLVSLLIPTRDRKDITELAVCSILEKTTYSNYEILILDNGSVEEETLEWFEAIQQQDERVKVLRYDYPFNYSAINNFGVEHAKGSIIGLVNNDVEVISPEWLTEMVSHAVRPDIGCVGAKLYYSNDLIQHAGVIVSLGGVAGHSHKYFNSNDPGYFARLKLIQAMSAVTAACLLVRKDVYEKIGGLDELSLRVAFNDVDFCLKVREAGYRNLWTPYAELYHHESISRGHEDTPEKQLRFQTEVETMKERWGKRLEVDPYYSPNLTKTREDFSIGEV
ncbi:MAG: family 2 glycosyl transferase [Marinobacter sp. T13-3]|nr:MAG: family 2 glycosyl transferase [Marinobacter sp. T13-3]